jgi:hypothetical protein
MSARIVISRAHRNALYRETLIDLSELDALRREYESEDPDMEVCERIGGRATDALRLIQDGGLGWGCPTADDSAAGNVELTLPAEELRRLILGKRGTLAQAAQMRQREREGTDSEWEQLDKAREACTSILDQLGDEGR